jgi:hypothetical protein
MGSELDYDASMRRLLSAALIILAFALLLPTLSAQNHGRGASPQGTAPTRGFRTPSGPAFVPRSGIGPTFRSPTPCCGTFSGGFTFGVGSPRNPFYPPNLGQHHHRGGLNNFGGFVGYPVPYAVPVYPYPYYGYDTSSQESQDTQAAEDVQQEAPAPTIFENRARRAAPPAEPVTTDSYAADQDTDATSTNAAVVANNVQPTQASVPEPTSILIFRDGHQLEVENYAIVGDTLYDLTPGHPRKIALAKIDLPATVEANDDRGIIFRVPLQN